MTLEAAHYAQGDAFQSEKRMVFAREWLPIAVKQQLAQPGRYVAAAAGGWPMLAVCGADGVVRAFRNTCRHRNMLLVEQDSGACENFRCRFHGWTYDLAGAFADAPPAVAPTDDLAQHALTPMALQPWRQVVLVNLQADAALPDCASLDAALPDGAASRAHYAGVRMADVSCNWKTLLELTLLEENIAWHWPTLLLRARDGLTLIDQIVPRTFLRTRVIRHAYTAGAGSAETAVQASLAELDTLKAQAEQLQTARVQGAAADIAHARVADLHARLAAAYAQDVAAA